MECFVKRKYILNKSPVYAESVDPVEWHFMHFAQLSQIKVLEGNIELNAFSWQNSSNAVLESSFQNAKISFTRPAQRLPNRDEH
jgi:hypothetical protein